MRNPFTLLASILSLLFVSFGVLSSGPNAFAVPVVAHGFGHLWSGDNRSWLGSHQLEDGNLGLCLQVAKAPPEGSDLSYVDGNSLGWFSEDDYARLAYFARNWAASTDPDLAAAAQLATWTITGLNGFSQEWFAKRANSSAEDVLSLTNQMLDLANGLSGASRSARAAVTLTLPDNTASGADRVGSVSADILVDFLATGVTKLARGAHGGNLTLTGALFDDGSANRVITNGETYNIYPTSTLATVEVTADVSFSDLPYGNSLTVALHPGDVQSLLVPSPKGLSVQASAHARGRSVLPFQPKVVTQTSEQMGWVGTSVHDELNLSLLTVSDTLSEWGIYDAGDGAFEPVPVTIESKLLGPYKSPITPDDDIPVDAPVVCTVEVVARRGPGLYRTPDCILPAEGYYVWVNHIDPLRTPRDQGGGSVLPWHSPFGETSEVSFVPFPPSISSTVSQAQVASGDCVSDTLHVTGLNPEAGNLPITSTLIGPITEELENGLRHSSLAGLPVAGAITTIVETDGDHQTDCIPVTQPGHYFFVYQSNGSEMDASGNQAVRPFADFTTYSSESTVVHAPLAPTGLTPPNPAITAASLGALVLGPTAVAIAWMHRRRTSASVHTPKQM